MVDNINFLVIPITLGNPKGNLLVTVWWISAVGEFNGFSIYDYLRRGFFAWFNREWPRLFSWNSYLIKYLVMAIILDFGFAVS